MLLLTSLNKYIRKYCGQSNILRGQFLLEVLQLEKKTNTNNESQFSVGS